MQTSGGDNAELARKVHERFDKCVPCRTNSEFSVVSSNDALVLPMSLWSWPYADESMHVLLLSQLRQAQAICPTLLK